MKPDHERVSKLLLDTVTLLCKNGLTYDQELKVQGLIGITLDNLEVFVVHINESFGTSGTPCVTISQNSHERETAASALDSDRQPSRKRHAPSQEEVVDLTRLVETPDIRPARLTLPAPPSHSESIRRQRAGPSIQSQQRSQNQTMPSPMTSLADVANRMLPPQGVPAGVPRNDVSGYQIPHAPAVRNNAMVAVGAENLRLASMNAPILRQRYPNYAQMHSSLQEEATAAVQRQHTQRVAMENKRMAAARMAAAAQHQLVGQPSIQIAGYPSSYGAPGSMQVAQNNYGMMPQRQRNPTMMQSSQQQQQQQQPQAVPSGSVGLPYRFSYHGNPHQYDGQARMFPSGSHVPNSVPTMQTERPRFAETSNPVQQLMLDYERLGQQSQTSILGPAALSTSSAAPFPITTGGSNNYATYDMQKQSHRPVQGASSPHDQAVMHHHIPQDYNPHGSHGIGKEYFTPSGVPSASPVRRSPRIRVEHIDLSQDIDDEVLQETLLSGLGTESGVPTSSIIIQPDNIDSTADVLQSAPLFETSGSSSLQVRTETSLSQQNQDRLEDNEEAVPAYNVQEILPIVDGLNGLDDFDGPNDATNNSQSRSPDGKLPTGLSDSGRSTGSERMDCTEESLPAQLDGCVDSRPVASGDEENEKPDQSALLLCADQVSQSQPMEHYVK